MRRQLIVVVAAAAAAVASLPAHAGTARTVKLAYKAATSVATADGTIRCCGVEVGAGNDPSAHEQFGFVWTKVRPTDRFARLTFRDQTGRPVQALLSQTTSHGFVELGTVCGGTTRRVRLAPGGGTFVIRPAYGACGSSPSVPTTGTVTVHITG